MEDDKYYSELQIMVDKAKDLKSRIDLMVDYEAKGYLKLALEDLYTNMRELIKQRDQS
jgi:flagellin-specific chaperone FliS